MNVIKNPNLTKYAQQLRKNMTKEERKLGFEFLKTLPVTIHRQKVIGSYIVDFYCAEKKLAIELDGSQHFEESGLAADLTRTEQLQQLGITVLRYSNLDVLTQFDSVCQDILKYLESFRNDQ